MTGRYMLRLNTGRVWRSLIDVVIRETRPMSWLRMPTRMHGGHRHFPLEMMKYGFIKMF